MESSSGDLDRFGCVIDRIYQGALDPRVWPEVVDEIAAWMDVKNALLFTPLNPKEADGLLFSHGFHERTLELWRTKYQMLDVWSQAVIERQLFWEGNAGLGTDLVSENELRGTPWYHEFLSIEDIPQLMTGVVFDGRTDGTLPTVCSLFRGERQSRFDASDLARFRLLLPHLSRALGVMYRLREAELRVAATLSALDRLPTGILLAAPPANIVFANRAALRMLEEQDGIRLREIPGKGVRLSVDDLDRQRQLDDAIRHCVLGDLADIPHFGLGVSITRPSGRAPYVMQFSALPERNEFGQGIATPRAIVFLADTTTVPSVDPVLLENLYELSRAEARLAVALIEGDDLQATAAKLGIGLNTAKTHLQRVYIKTGVDNRAKLIKLLIALGTVDAD